MYHVIVFDSTQNTLLLWNLSTTNQKLNARLKNDTLNYFTAVFEIATHFLAVENL